MDTRTFFVTQDREKSTDSVKGAAAQESTDLAEGAAFQESTNSIINFVHASLSPTLYCCAAYAYSTLVCMTVLFPH